MTPEQGQLRQAVWERDLDAVRALLDAGTDPNIAGLSETQPLFHAAFWGDAEMARLLVAYGANLRPPKQYPYSPTYLEVAAQSQSVDAVRVFLDAGFPVNEVGARGTTPLMQAVKVRNPLHNGYPVAVIAELLARGADIHARDDKGMTALHFAAWENFAVAADLLLTHGTDVNVTTTKGETPLFYAVQARQKLPASVEGLIRLLLDAGAAVNHSDKRGSTPLHIAAASASIDVLQTLLNAGANLSATRRGGKTPLADAIKWAETFAFLLEAGAEIMPLIGASGKPALLTAVEAENVDAIVALLAVGANPNEIYRGKLPLHAAIRKANTTIVDALLQSGVDISLPDKTGLTGLEYARKRRRKDILALIEAVEAARQANN